MILAIGYKKGGQSGSKSKSFAILLKLEKSKNARPPERQNVHKLKMA